MEQNQPKAEVERLESLWKGQFGDDYVDRNADTCTPREPFWRMIMEELSVKSVLEVGCNIGANLRWIAKAIPPEAVWGIDINRKSLAWLRKEYPEINAIWGMARELPFRDRWFDMVFTTGVLIHQPVEAQPLVMSEIVRCSSRYVICGEYYAETLTEVNYRQQMGALFKRDYGGLYQQLFPELKLLKKGFLSKDEGWDDVTYWVFEKKPG